MIQLPEGVDVTGVGEAAYWSTNANVLWFTRGGSTWAVQIQATQIAQRAVSRM